MISQNDNLLFQEEDTQPSSTNANHKHNAWKVLIVDDENDVHEITKIAFRYFEFENKTIEFFSAYSAAEAKKIMSEVSDIALILLDVVMEEEDSGLRFVKFLRQEVNQKLTRVIIRTGQPGQAPEKKVMIEYDINDYKEKTDLTQDKFFTTMVMALRSYRDLTQIEKNRLELLLTIQAQGRFIPYNFLSHLGKSSITDIALGDHVETALTVLFLDIRGFTAACQKLTPGESYDFVNSLMACIEPAITQQNGFIDKYIGDCIMALFSKTDDAISASINMIKSLNAYNKKRISDHENHIDVGIGIDGGTLVLGTIGFHDRMDCTVIGNVVNTAAKVEKMNKHYGSRLLITGAAYDSIENKNIFSTKLLGKIKITDDANEISLYEVNDKNIDELKKYSKLK